MKTKFTMQELKDKNIAVELDTAAQYQIMKGLAKVSGLPYCNIFSFVKNNKDTGWYYYTFINKFTLTTNEHLTNKTIISASEFFLEDEPEVKEPELNLTQCVHLSAENAQDLLLETHYEYAVLTNATESAKKQIAEFEQALAQIKIDAMKLGSRDLARLIKALKAI